MIYFHSGLTSFLYLFLAASFFLFFIHINFLPSFLFEFIFSSMNFISYHTNGAFTGKQCFHNIFKFCCREWHHRGPLFEKKKKEIGCLIKIFIINGFRTIVFIFIVISTTFRPICPSVRPSSDVELGNLHGTSNYVPY